MVINNYINTRVEYYHFNTKSDNENYIHKVFVLYYIDLYTFKFKNKNNSKIKKKHKHTYIFNKENQNTTDPLE